MSNQIEQPDFETMSADDWEEYLESHQDQALIAMDGEGTHEFAWDEEEERVTFWAYGSQGYDEDGTRAALETVAGQSDGIALVGSEEVQ